MTDPRIQSRETVQFFLDQVDIRNPISVIFLKKDGTQRQVTGHLIPSDNRTSQIPVSTEEGFKSFNIERVLSIVELQGEET